MDGIASESPSSGPSPSQIAKQFFSKGESWASTEGARKSFISNRSRDTKPELALRRALHARGLRYRVAGRPIPSIRRRADIVFGPAKVAVFLDGCFWHGCPIHFKPPVRHADYWEAKIGANQVRDREADRILREADWQVIRVWEHQPPEEAGAEIAELVRARATSSP